MTIEGQKRLLGREDPDPVVCINAKGGSPFLIVADHAGVSVPKGLNSLGIKAEDFDRHIASDIGSRALGTLLANSLDAVFIYQVYSRLVVDCNRHPESSEAVLSVSDGTTIPANVGLSLELRQQRIDEIHAPYQAAIAHELGRRAEAQKPTIFVSLHSFAPVLQCRKRPWHVGILHNGANDRFAKALINALEEMDGIDVGDNQPYKMDATDHTVPIHAFSPYLLYAEIEIRQDLIANREGCKAWSALLAPAMREACVRR